MLANKLLLIWVNIISCVYQEMVIVLDTDYPSDGAERAFFDNMRQVVVLSLGGILEGFLTSSHMDDVRQKYNMMINYSK